MDINKLFSQLGNMKSELDRMTNQNKDELKKIKYHGKSGDDGIEIEVTIDGNKDLENIKFSEGMKKYIHDDPDGFWDILADLIITAFKKASSDLDNGDNSDNGSMNDIMKTVQNMTGVNDIEKLLGNIGGNFGKRKK
jgi:DNA-binding protein YbaB